MWFWMGIVPDPGYAAPSRIGTGANAGGADQGDGMKTTQTLIAGCCLALALAGCTRNTVIVLAPQQLNGIVTVNCWRPEDKQQHYLTAHETLQIVVKAPKAAEAQHVNGCAAVKFQLTKSGRPRNMTVLRELPAGYGYGAAVVEQLEQETFAPPASPDGWYYRAVSIGFSRAAAPVRPFNQPPKPESGQPMQYRS